MTWYYRGRRGGAKIPVEEANLETLELSGGDRVEHSSLAAGDSRRMEAVWRNVQPSFGPLSRMSAQRRSGVDRPLPGFIHLPKVQTIVLPEGSRGIGQRRNSELRRILVSVFCLDVGLIVLVFR